MTFLRPRCPLACQRRLKQWQIILKHTTMIHTRLESKLGVSFNLLIKMKILKKTKLQRWHLGFCNLNYTPAYRGFDSFYGYYNGAEDYYYHNVTTGTCKFRNEGKIEFFTLILYFK